MIFGSRTSKAAPQAGDFGYLPAGSCYMDSACQTLRPQCVLEAEAAYYRERNACGGRVHYRWGREVDDQVTQAREALLRFSGKHAKDYATAFTLNTTYGINLVLSQLPGDGIDAIVTSDIEHNSVFLPVMTWAKTHGKQRIVLQRREDGSIDPATIPSRSLVLVNSTSNIDGRMLGNARELAEHVHAGGGLLLLDAAQTFGHHPEFLRDVDFDAAFGSGHKMYGPSIGCIIIRRALLQKLQPTFIGGGTVKDVRHDDFDLLTADEAHAVLEPGLQNWAGIIGLKRAIEWLEEQDIATRETAMAKLLWEGLKSIDRISPVNTGPSSIVSFSVEGIDAHQVAILLDHQSIMCRSGHFCCHYYLQHSKHLPALVRVSLGMNNTASDIEQLCAALTAITRSL